MASLWPDFAATKLGDGTLIWIGPLRPKAQPYTVGIVWRPSLGLPYVTLEAPKLTPRPGVTFSAIPHLLYNGDNPERSGLCLFDPKVREWSAGDLIAETTVRWTAEWLTYYELWHMTGEWLAPSVGPESVAQAEAAGGDIGDVH
ncbi:hypothetical protein ACFOWB_25290 [Chenggangzhangella methanolivorans]|uniref:hypothetical protein n=1 Tax=Chenggangzhangella methanolivorans TaxID=1437009 RepID=UPI003620E50F